MHQSLEMKSGTVRHCLEVFQAIQTDSRTSGWYWGDVRGKATVAEATTALWRKDLICSRVGPPPFRLTPKGETFLKTHKKAWEAFLVDADRLETLEHFATALKQVAEVHEARDAV